jgi:predicted transcriptional regulator
MTVQLLPDITRNNHGGNAESEAANTAIHFSKQETREQVLKFITNCRWSGATADEVAAKFGCSHNHVAPRITELVKDNLLVKTGIRRITRSGCAATVLIAPMWA